MTPKKIAAFAIGPIGGALFALMTLPIVAWLFSPDDIGRLSMLQVVVSFTILLFSLGLDQAYVREFHEVENKPALLKAVFLPGAILLFSVLIVVLLLPLSISELLFGIDSTLLTGLLIAAIFLQFCSRFLSLILRMQEKGLAYSMSQILPKFLFLVILVAYFLFNVEAVFDNLMIANWLSLSAVFLIYSWNTRRDWLPALTTNIDKVKQKQMIHFGLPLIGSGLSFWGLTAMDKLFLRALSSFEELGIYSVSISFASVALIFQAVFSTVWAPVVYKWAAEGIDPDKIKSVTDYSTLAVIVIWSLAGMLSWVVSFLLPEQYDQVQYILLAAIAYPLLYTLSEATGVGIGILRKTTYSMLAAATALVVNILGNYLLVPSCGAAGAAMASAVAFFVFFIIRTEASALLWNSFKRIKMYCFVFILLLISLAVNIFAIELSIVITMYMSSLLLSLLAYSTQVIKLHRYISSFLADRFKTGNDISS